mmetsp:Transcript_68074/g.108002  ORF Transcript_68074/g.108002 Transcript_68074/m.108002 type:complete len:154 (+) Transcript_68074:79-540(+)
MGLLESSLQKCLVVCMLTSSFAKYFEAAFEANTMGQMAWAMLENSTLHGENVTYEEHLNALRRDFKARLRERIEHAASVEDMAQLNLEMSQLMGKQTSYEEQLEEVRRLHEEHKAARQLLFGDISKFRESHDRQDKEDAAQSLASVSPHIQHG